MKSLVPALLLAAAVQAGAQTASAPAAAAPVDPVLEARVMRIAAELRCLVCQNQTIADSHADLALDLRRQTREMLLAGKSEQDVLDFMTQRYGDFVLYRPPVKSTTLLLWAGPAVLLVVGALTLVVVLRRRRNLPDEAFEADAGLEPNDPDGADGRR
jgi:cytochrome c-type biogenesis protein CcmH